MRIDAAIGAAAAKLQNADVENAARESRLLLGFVLQKDETYIFAHPETELSVDEIKRFDKAVERRAAREPFHYIVGSREFYGLEFIVTPDVLIPRPETELLVEDAIRFLTEAEDPLFLDIGTGSGCIAVAMLKNAVNAVGHAVDISPDALAIAEANAVRHGVIGRSGFYLSDAFSAVQEIEFDLIVSNPPYISTDEMLDIQPEVIGHEPSIALTDGADGLSIIGNIIENAPRYLRRGGKLLIEIGASQSPRVGDMFSRQIWSDITFIPDLQQIPRIASARIR